MVSFRSIAEVVAELRAFTTAHRRRSTPVTAPGPAALITHLLGSSRAVEIEDRPGGITFRFSNGDSGTRLTCVLHHASPAPLTAAEAAVAEHVCEGRTIAQIARLRGVSVNTIKSQVRQVFRKLDVDSRVALVRRLAP